MEISSVAIYFIFLLLNIYKTLNYCTLGTIKLSNVDLITNYIWICCIDCVGGKKFLKVTFWRKSVITHNLVISLNKTFKNF